MIIDTDILIWYLRGNLKAKSAVEQNIPFSLSVVSYIELVQGMNNKAEFIRIQKQIKKWNTEIIQIDKDISSRAMFYVQEFAFSHAVTLADALIAATAIQNNERLFTANVKHYKFIPNIDLLKFNPT